jgi:hypothetical protein
LDTCGIPGIVLSSVNDNSTKLDSGDESDDRDAQSPREVGWEFAPIETPYLKQLKVTHRARARAAMRWRPRFLKALAMACSLTDALKAAHVCFNTVRAHERSDPEFAAQLKDAEQEGAELLHSVCWKSAIEGNVEPVFFQGQIVGHIRKYDSRMQIELLRAHMPHLFKTPGSRAPVISGDNKQALVIDAAEREKLIRLRREALEAMRPKPLTDTASNEAAQDSGNSSGIVQ